MVIRCTDNENKPKKRDDGSEGRNSVTFSVESFVEQDFKWVRVALLIKQSMIV